MEDHKIYLLKTDFTSNSGEFIYKVGRTNQRNLLRLKGYPKTFKLIYSRACFNSLLVETQILSVFIQKYKKHSGNEYFVGNVNEMICDIDKIIKDQNTEEENIINDNPIIINEVECATEACCQSQVVAHQLTSDYNKNYYIKCCDQIWCDRKMYLDHKKHMLEHAISFTPSENVYYCELCLFSSEKIIDIRRHLKTKKHQNNISQTVKTYNCEICNKQYIKYKSFYAHKKKCKKIEPKPSPQVITPDVIQLLFEKQQQMFTDFIKTQQLDQNQIIEKLTETCQNIIISNTNAQNNQKP